MDQTNMLANTVETVKQARALGATIVYEPITFTDDYHELSPNPTASRFAREAGARRLSTSLNPRPAISSSRASAACADLRRRTLDFILRSRGISTIALGGFLTNCCVESTMPTGYEKGYDVITLKDCTATLSEEEQRVAVEKSYPMFSRPMTHGEFLSMLKGTEKVETKSRGYEAG
jgi:ureidoacrylate peracid hydrolase